MNLYDELKWRGLIYAVTDPEIENVLNNEKVTFYLGTDPTGDSLHIGHLFPFLTAKRLESYGHKAILLIGGATGLIGDPRGTSERQLLTLEKSLENAQALTNQVKTLFNCEMANNYDWISKIDMISFLRDYGKNFNINYMLSKETVKKRLEIGISYTEFSYQILQALDFEHLYKNYNCRLQIGGQDQWGNIVSGIDLIHKLDGSDAKVFGLTVPLITNSDGSKFGKSEGASVWLDPKKTSPYEFYQYWVNVADTDVILRLKQFTFLSKERIEEIEEDFKLHPENRLAQKELAKDVTLTVHGEEGLKQALAITEALFSGNVSNLKKDEIEIAFKGFETLNKEEINLVDALIETHLASSKREAREFITNGAVMVNGVKVNDLTYVLNKSNALDETYSVIRRGKKKYSLIKH